MWKILRSSWDLCYNRSLYFIFFFLSWERVNEYHTSDSLVEACRGQRWKISEAGFSACWKEGLSRSVPRPGSMLPSHLESLWVWGVLVYPFTSVMDSTQNHTAFNGTWSNRLKVQKVWKDSIQLSRLFPLVFLIWAQGTMNKDLRFGKKGQPPGFGHGRRHSCLGYVAELN